LLISAVQAQAGKKLKVLFIGNSYTYVNSMPQIAADIATSMGDTLVWDMEAPGGSTFIQHFAFNPPTITKLQAGDWDYVVLQEQSQTPALPVAQVHQGMFPYAKKLDSLVNLYNSCAETIFYMTWGRKNGDTSNCSFYTTQYNWPWFCTYQGMDSLIRLRYRMMADSNNAVVSPAGAVWHYIRTYYPSINLYDPDESHPSQAGSYAAACSFYTTLFKKDPSLIPYNYTLNGTDAANIRTAAKKVVFDSMLYWHIGQYRTEASFTFTAGAGTVSFTNTSLNASSYTWHFGDGQTATAPNPTHSYTQSGTYKVMLIATGANACSDTSYATVTVFATVIADIGEDIRITIAPNPSRGVFTLDLPSQNTKVSVLNLYGQVLYSSRANGPITIDISNRPKGIYVVRVSMKEGTWNAKVLVQ
jgi:hypothetical protein